MWIATRAALTAGSRVRPREDSKGYAAACYAHGEMTTRADAERQAEALVASARQARPSTPRWLWVLAAIVGVGCTIAFVLAMLAAGGEAPMGPPQVAVPPTSGFMAGLAIGIGIGIAVGLVIARQVHSSRNRP